MKDLIFVDVNDGSTSRNLQTVIKKDARRKPGHASSVYAKGILAETPKGQLELIADDFEVIGTEFVLMIKIESNFSDSDLVFR